MGRDNRAFTQPWRLVEVTTVTIQNRYLLRPSKKLNDLVVGVVARAQRKYKMPVICITVMSSHLHILLHARDPEVMAQFMGFVKTNLSKEVGRLHRWPGPMFADRYHHVEVSDEESDQVERLRYCLANGVKELLVDRPEQWPGVHSATALVEGEELVGHWYDRTKEHAARQRGEKDVDEEQFASEELLAFSPLPCWAHLSEAEYRRRIAELIEQIADEGERERCRTGSTSMGVASILSADYHYRPRKVAKSPKPRFHAKSQAVWKRMWEAWREITAAFREASARLLSGERNVEFPEGTFPPHQPFVPFAETLTIEPRGQPA